MELVNVDPAVMKHIYTLFSKDSCAPVLAQIALNVMVNPPRPGDPSHRLYNLVRTETCSTTRSKNLLWLIRLEHCRVPQETKHIKTTLLHNAKRVYEVVNSLSGVCCQPMEGGAYLFPRLYLPPKAIQKAKVTSSHLWC